MKRYIAVFHRYFGSADKMIAIEFGSEIGTAEEAKREALVRVGQMSYGGYSVAMDLIELGEKETSHFAPRKLTWKERLTGRIDPTITDAVPVRSIEAMVINQTY